MLEAATQFFNDYGNLLIEGVQDTLVMTSVATLFAYLIGLPVGVLLITSNKKGICPNAPINAVLGWICLLYTSPSPRD